MSSKGNAPDHPSEFLPGPDAVEAFRNKVRKYYGEGAREFPWRHHPDPYAIMVSEFMLQQTQTARVLGYFQPFLDQFPDPERLAAAPAEKVLKRWQGLGYNRRGMYLHRTAQILIQDHGGILPADPESLTSLPGIGPNTAGAILCFAWDLPFPFLETNIKAALIHEFFPGQDKVDDSRLRQVGELVMDRNHPREWFYALVDLGVYVKKQYGNPSRKAATWRKQSGFAGSLRQVRGSILRTILAEGWLHQEILKYKIAEDLSLTESEDLIELYPKITRALKSLNEEGLLAEKTGFYGPPA